MQHPHMHIVLAFLAMLVSHDVVMAADPHGVVPSHDAHGTVHESSDASCNLPEGVRPEPPVRPEPAVPSLANIATLYRLRVDAGPVSWVDAPILAPDVRRALLQVFLN